MIEFDFQNRTIRGTAKAGDIRERGLINASMEENENGNTKRATD